MPSAMANRVAAINERRAFMRLTLPRFELLLFIACVAAAAAIGNRAAAQERPTRTEIWDLTLGTAVSQLPDAFTDYACGTNGGPPSVPLKSFGDFKRCRPEPSGLRE